MLTGHGQLAFVPSCPNCGVRNVYLEVFAGRSRNITGRDLYEVQCPCGQKQAYHVETSVLHTGQGWNRQDSHGYWRTIRSRYKTRGGRRVV